MRIERYSSLLDQILNQHKVNPIDEVFLSSKEFDLVVYYVHYREIMDHEDWDSTGEKLVSFTIKHCAIKFNLEK